MCNDARALRFVRPLLDNSFDKVFLLRRGEAREIDQQSVGYGGRNISTRNLPIVFCCAFVHSGDQHLLRAGETVIGTTFVFSSPGVPATSSEQIAIQRQTAPQFTLTDADIKETVAFALGEQSQLPKCCFSEEDAGTQILQHVHDISNAVNKDPQSKASDLHFMVFQLQKSLRLHERFEQALLLDDLAVELENLERWKRLKPALLGALKQIEDNIAAATMPEVDSEAEVGSLPANPPDGYGTVLVADDDGYPAECVERLRSLGYRVSVCDQEDEVRSEIEWNCSAVFLCDLTWGSDPMAGRRLMALAGEEKSCRVIIALSGSRLSASEVPEAHELCVGTTAKTENGALEVHKLIWKQAIKQQNKPTEKQPN